MGALRPFLHFMNQKVRRLLHGAMIAALYAALSYFQNMLLPGSGSWAIQFRVAEALCVLAFFTPAAVTGLTIGCLVFNLTSAGALPLDFLVGSLATFWAAWGMRRLRRWPIPALLLPAICNGLLVGWELTVHIGGGFWINAGYVAAGELGVLLTLGWLLYRTIKQRNLDKALFG